MDRKIRRYPPSLWLCAEHKANYFRPMEYYHDSAHKPDRTDGIIPTWWIRKVSSDSQRMMDFPARRDASTDLDMASCLFLP